MAALQVYADDTHPDIKYEGPWTVATGRFRRIGNYGIPYLNGLHAVSGPGKLSFSFVGTQVSVLGVNEHNGTADAYECRVDGQIIPSRHFDFTLANWEFCASDTLNLGDHTVELSVTPTADTPTVYFDYIAYRPGPDVQLEGRSVNVDDQSPLITYRDATWVRVDTIVHQTQTQGAKVTISFSGTLLAWYGWIPTGFPTQSADATWAVDGGPETTFEVRGLKPIQTAKHYHQLIFQTTLLAPGPHVVEVVYKGDATTAPLGLDHVMVDWADADGAVTKTTPQNVVQVLSSPAVMGTGGLPNPSNGSTPATGTPRKRTGAVVGAVIAAVALAVLLFLLVLFLVRRKKQRAKSGPDHESRHSLAEMEMRSESIQPYTTFPSATVPSRPVITPGKAAIMDPELNHYPLAAIFPTNVHGSSMLAAHSQMPSFPPQLATRPLSPLRDQTPGTGTEASSASFAALCVFDEAPAPSDRTGASRDSQMPLMVELERERSTGGRRIFHQHTDSGLRMARPHNTEPAITELPPQYTSL